MNLEIPDQEEEPLVAEIDCESTDEENVSDEEDLNEQDTYPSFDQVDEEIQTTIESLNSLEINQSIGMQRSKSHIGEVIPGLLLLFKTWEKMCAKDISKKKTVRPTY